MIYSGSTPNAVVHTPHDVVVGPVRFGDLNPSLAQKAGGSRSLGIKSPMTVGPTQFPELLVSAKGAKGHCVRRLRSSPIDDDHYGRASAEIEP